MEVKLTIILRGHHEVFSKLLQIAFIHANLPPPHHLLRASDPQASTTFPPQQWLNE